MKALRRYAPVLGLILFGALVWLAIYAYQDGFTKKWRKLIIKEFAKHDLTVSFDTLTIDPFQGLVANKVILLDEATQQEIARVSQARLDVDLGKLIREERFLQRIELDSANVSLPYDRKDPNSKRIELRNLQANVLLPEGRIEIVNAQADFYGLILSLTGTLERPVGGDQKPIRWQSEKIRAARPFLEKLVKVLGPLKSKPGLAPELNMLVSGDLSSPESLELKARLHGKDFQYADLTLDELAGDALVTDRFITVSQLNLADSLGGQFHASGQFPLKGKQEAQITLSSDIHISKLLPDAPATLGLATTLNLTKAPQFALKGTMQLDQPFTWSAPPVDLTGNVAVDSFYIGEELFERAQADFRVKGAHFFARNILLAHPFGQSSGQIIRSPNNDLLYELDLGMDPTLLRQLPLPEDAAAFLARWEFRPKSGVEMRLAGQRSGEEAATWSHVGEASLTECRFENAEMEKLRFDFELQADDYQFTNLETLIKPDAIRQYSGGTIKAERIRVAQASKLTTVTSLQGAIDPGQIVRCFNQNVADRFDDYRFSEPPEISITQGIIDPAGTQTNVQIEVKAVGSVATQVLERPLNFERPRFGLHLYGDSLLVRLHQASLLGGKLTGSANIQQLQSTRDYGASIDLTEIDFEQLAAVYFPDKEADGVLVGNFNWRGRGTSAEAISGRGSAHLANTSLLEVPVLRPFSTLVKRILGKTKQTQGVVNDLGVEFQLESSSLTLETIKADLGEYLISGKGTVELPSTDVDLAVSLTSQEAPTAVLNVLYEIFGTYQCTGTLEKPKWTMVNRGAPRNAIKKVNEELEKADSDIRIDPEEVMEIDPKELLKELIKKAREREDEP